MSVGVRHVCLDRSPLFDLPTRDARSRGFLMKNTASITLHAPRCPLLASSSARPAAALRDISTYGFVCVRVCDSKVQIAKFQVLFMASFYAVTVHKICSPQECATSISTTWMIISANSVTISRTEENMHVRGRRMWTCCSRLAPSRRGRAPRRAAGRRRGAQARRGARRRARSCTAARPPAAPCSSGGGGRPGRWESLKGWGAAIGSDWAATWRGGGQ